MLNCGKFVVRSFLPPFLNPTDLAKSSRKANCIREKNGKYACQYRNETYGSGEALCPAWTSALHVKCSKLVVPASLGRVWSWSLACSRIALFGSQTYPHLPLKNSYSPTRVENTGAEKATTSFQHLIHILSRIDSSLSAHYVWIHDLYFLCSVDSSRGWSCKCGQSRG